MDRPRLRHTHLHVPDGALVAVVDHLLEPEALVQHPHDDQPLLVASREFRVRGVPGDAHLPTGSAARFVGSMAKFYRILILRLKGVGRSASRRIYPGKTRLIYVDWRKQKQRATKEYFWFSFGTTQPLSRSLARSSTRRCLDMQCCFGDFGVI